MSDLDTLIATAEGQADRAKAALDKAEASVARLISYGKNGHEFNLIIRRGDLAIFRGISRANGSETFELIEIQRHDGREIGGKHFPPAEFAPSNEQWGSKGWTFPTLGQATTRLGEMVEVNP